MQTPEKIRRMAESLWDREDNQPVVENNPYLEWALPIFERFTAQQFLLVLGEDYQESFSRASAFANDLGSFFFKHTTYQEVTDKGESHQLQIDSLKLRWDDENWELHTILMQTANCQTLSFLRVGHLGRSVEINNLTKVIK